MYILCIIKAFLLSGPLLLVAFRKVANLKWLTLVNIQLWFKSNSSFKQKLVLVWIWKLEL